MIEKETIILDADGIKRALIRVAHEILEKNKGTADLALIGIRTGGDHLARLLRDRIKEIEGIDIPLGAVDITMYRDDIGSRSSRPVGLTEIPFALDGKKVVLVDEVIFTGRTIRAAMDALIDLGRPRCIQLAVLIDRGHRELPIRPDFVGRNVPTAREEDILVEFDASRAPQTVRLVRD